MDQPVIERTVVPPAIPGLWLGVAAAGPIYGWVCRLGGETLGYIAEAGGQFYARPAGLSDGGTTAAYPDLVSAAEALTKAPASHAARFVPPPPACSVANRQAVRRMLAAQ